MLQHLLIKDFAIIENIEIAFEDGLNVITGETGSGKSIVIEAISLALGSRADSSFVRFGKDKAIIQLACTLGGEDFVLTREISAAGKNLCRINGQIVTLGELAALAHQIADIHGQYDNQLLLDPERHLSLVDHYDAGVIAPIRSEFQSCYEAYKAKRTELDALIRTQKENQRKADFLRFEVDEIRQAELRPGEDRELTERIALLQNSEKIYRALESAYTLLEGEDANVLSGLGQVQTSLDSVRQYSGKLTEISASVNDAYYALQDAASEVAQLRDNIVFSPAELDQAISRLDRIDELKKKYGPEIEDVIRFADQQEEILLSIEQFDSQKAILQKDTQECLTRLKSAAARLTEVRTESARKLGSAIQQELRDLNFQDARIEIPISPAPAITSEGADHGEIMIAANRGEPLKPLVRVASGGEISRIMLAIKNITGAGEGTPTMIFDEIDAGISGVTASIVGRKLKEIAEHHQIICITHLPQIAACGNASYRIYKESDDASTYTHVDRLSPEETVREIARLLGGEIITETTLQSARELIESSR